MRWRVVGFDAQTGLEMVKEIDARDEVEARGLGQYSGIDVTEVSRADVIRAAPPAQPTAAARQNAGVIPYVAAKTGDKPDDAMTELAQAAEHARQSMRVLGRSPRTRQWVIAAVGLLAGAAILAESIVISNNWAGRRAANAPSAPVSGPRAAPVTPRSAGMFSSSDGKLTYEQIVQEIGGVFVLSKEPLMDGATRYIGRSTATNEHDTLVLEGTANDIRYAHMAIHIDGEIMTAAKSWRAGLRTPLRNENAKAQMTMMNAFLSGCAPAWSPGPRTWLELNIDKAVDGVPQEIAIAGISVRMTWDRDYGFLKIVVLPAK